MNMLKSTAAVAIAMGGLGGVVSQGAVLLDEPFAYADGELGAASGGTWVNHSGTNGGQTVVSQALAIDDAGNSDYNRSLSATQSTGDVYASFALNVSADDLPSASGGQYFAHMSGEQTSGAGTFFASRVALATGGAEGTFKIGIAGNGSTFTFLADDFAPGTTYTVVHAYDLDADVATLWVNPSSETSTNVTSASTVMDIPIARYAFRISGSTDGDKTIDNLLVGTQFADVAVPEPTSFAALGLGALGILRRRRGR